MQDSNEDLDNKPGTSVSTDGQDPMGQIEGSPMGLTQWIGLIGGPVLFILMVLSETPEGLSLAGWRTAAVAALMATWWVTEVIPISATALLPIILFPIFGISTIVEATTPYANPMIFLFMGGFIIAIAMQRWDLHRRIALNIITIIGSKPRSIIVGFMVSTAFMSMWVSNTAATMMMLPIAMSVIQLTKSISRSEQDSSQYRNFALTLMLAIAFSASVGGLGTIIGTPTNALMIAFVGDAYGIEITFAQWMMVGLPVVILGLPIIFYTLANLVYPVRLKSLPGGKEYIKDEMVRLGTISKPEIQVAVIFTLIAVLWMGRPLIEGVLPGLSDAGIAIFGAVILFLIPVDLKRGIFLMRWKDAEELPWGVLILFGGGLTLAGAIQRTGLAEWVGGFFGVLSGWHVLFIILIVSLVIIMFTELASNSATAAAFLPVIASVAIAIGQDPLLLAVPVAIVASCAFMLPVATPPNAIVYGSGVMSIPEMAKAGLALNFFFAILVTLLTYFLFTAILGIEIGTIPAGIMP
ncbi:MAG: DASS family sodium-coupled anion symporter [Balneolaceae bacterium]